MFLSKIGSIKSHIADHLPFYKNFKQSFEIGHYLNVLSSKFRIVISRLRLSAHQLRMGAMLII